MGNRARADARICVGARNVEDRLDKYKLPLYVMNNMCVVHQLQRFGRRAAWVQASAFTSRS